MINLVPNHLLEAYRRNIIWVNQYANLDNSGTRGNIILHITITVFNFESSQQPKPFRRFSFDLIQNKIGRENYHYIFCNISLVYILSLIPTKIQVMSSEYRYCALHIEHIVFHTDVIKLYLSHSLALLSFQAFTNYKMNGCSKESIKEIEEENEAYGLNITFVIIITIIICRCQQHHSTFLIFYNSF